MKKFFPIALVLMIFSGFLGVQIIFDDFFTTAKLSSKEKSQYAHYSRKFKSLKAITSELKEIDFSQVQAPVVILNFWASWCHPCLEELPLFNQLRSKFDPKDVLILGINSDEENQMQKIKEIKRKYSLKFDSIADREGSISTMFHVSSLPVTMVFINGEVKEVYRKVIDFAGQEGKDLVNTIELALNSKSSTKI